MTRIPNKMIDKSAVQRLKKYFKKHNDIVMAFLFGSRVFQKTRGNSDWDIAIYFKPEKESVEWEEQDREYPEEDRIWDDCAKILKNDNVDLLVLNRAPAAIAASATRGIPLIIKDRNLWLKFMLIVTREAEDYRRFVGEYYAISQRSASLSSEDKENLRKTLLFLEEQMTLYSYFSNLSEDEYRENVHKRNEAERWIENLVNAGIDIAKIILASQKKPVPATYRETVKSGMRLLKLPKDFASKFEGWVKFRNILAHEYLDVKWRRIADFIKNSETYFQQMAETVKRQLEKNKDL